MTFAFGASILAGNYYIWWAAQLLAIVVLVFAVLRWRPKFLGGKTIGGTLDATLEKREEAIRVQLEAAERSRQEAAAIREQSRQDVESARRQANEIVARAEHTSEAIQKEMESRAHQEYERVVGQAKDEIDYERRQAELALRRRAADIVVDAAGQVISQNLSPEADQRIIAGSLNEWGDGR